MLEEVKRRGEQGECANKALIVASRRGWGPVVAWLLSTTCAQPDLQALIYAAEGGHLACVDAFLATHGIACILERMERVCLRAVGKLTWRVGRIWEFHLMCSYR